MSWARPLSNTGSFVTSHRSQSSHNPRQFLTRRAYSLRGAAGGDAAEQQGEQPVEPRLGLGQPVQLHGQHVQPEAVALGGREACRVLGRGREQREVARRRRRSSSGGASGAWSGSAHTSGSSQPRALSVSKKRCGRAVPVKPTTRLRASRAAA